MAIYYTSSLEYSVNGGRNYQLYDANYTGSLDKQSLYNLLPIGTHNHALFRSYKSGSEIGSAESNTQFFYVGGMQVKFSSYYTTNTYQYMCVVKRGEFNGSMNPSLYDISGSAITQRINIDTSGSSIILDVNNEEFTPYITTIGLYDDSLQLVAYAKLARPIKISKDFDSVFIVKFDV